MGSMVDGHMTRYRYLLLGNFTTQNTSSVDLRVCVFGGVCRVVEPMCISCIVIHSTTRVMNTVYTKSKGNVK